MEKEESPGWGRVGEGEGTAGGHRRGWAREGVCARFAQTVYTHLQYPVALPGPRVVLTTKITKTLPTKIIKPTRMKTALIPVTFTTKYYS